MVTDPDNVPTEDIDNRKKLEVRSFLFLAVLLAPAIAVAFVGSLGLIIWIYQLIAGPPGPIS